MRKIILFALIVLAFPAVVQARELARNHSIHIEVECIEAATEVIAGLNGYNAHSFVMLTQDDWRNANFTRRVDEWAFRHVQEVLRDLGEVLYESENSQYHGAEILNLETQISVLSQEMERLSLMMAASTSLDVLIAVNDRLARVSRDRDSLTGRRNFLRAQMASPIVHIELFETPEEPPVPDPVTFGERVSYNFHASWGATRRFAGNTLVFLARRSLPLVIYGTLAGIAAIIVLRQTKKAAHQKKEAENVS